MKMVQKEHKYDDLSPVYGLGVRHIQVILICFWNFLCYTMCNIMPTCIVAMTDPHASPNKNIPTFSNWSDQSIILSSFGWGYTVPQLFGGHYAQLYGVKWFFIGIMGFCVICNLVLPTFVVCFGSVGLMICYALQGCVQGFGNVMIPEFINIWIPRSERTSLGNAVFAAYGPGCVFATNIAGILSSSRWGWPSVFYFIAALGVIWLLLMLVFGENCPEQHKTITEQELCYIMHEKSSSREMKIPWLDVLNSKPMWALWIAHAGGQVIYWLTYIEFPTYINRVFGFSVRMDSEILSIAYLVCWLLSLVVGGVVEYLTNMKIIATGTLRKICNTIASIGPAVCLTSLSYLNRDYKEFAIYLVMVMFLTLSTASSGYMINYNDIAPNFCGTLYGIGGFLSCIASLTAVAVTQVEVINQKNPRQWAYVLWYCSFVAVASNINYIIFGSGEIQEWNEGKKPNNDDETLAILSMKKRTLEESLNLLK